MTARSQEVELQNAAEWSSRTLAALKTLRFLSGEVYSLQGGTGGEGVFQGLPRPDTHGHAASSVIGI
jgi:hypothetical protein